jgi:endonuclease YncB( thermonuclease family)
MKALVALFVLTSSCASAADLAGVPRVVDGDTVIIGDTRIRLEGIDAPETDQFCLDADGKKWTCGISARNALDKHVAGRSVVCADKGRDRYGRTLAVCSIGAEDLNAWMVQEGLALAYIQYSNAYVREEAESRAARRGLWAGAFIAPWEWRHRDKTTVVRGALSVPISAQAQLLAPVSAEGAPSPECAIKGNVNRYGERIYHLPGTRSYGSVNMADPAKRWFCSEVEAEAAGWRRPGR